MSKPTATPLAGSCRCGKISFTANSFTPYPYQICHCSICTKASGSFAINIMAISATLKVKGEEYLKVFNYNKAELGKPEDLSPHSRYFCGECGSHLYAINSSYPENFYPVASCIDTPLPVVPVSEQYHIMTVSKPKHIALPTGVTPANVFPGYPSGGGIAEWHQQRGRYGTYVVPSNPSPAPAFKVVFLRHGESIWNKENRFTGWTDVDLSKKGLEEAKLAGETLKKEGFEFDVAFTSVLKRAIRTLWISLEELGQMYLPVEHSWRLNERHYGALQGLNKKETAEKHGDDQVLIWRRSYNVPPPSLEEEDPRYPGNQPQYAKMSKSVMPRAECLKDAVDRVLPFWHDSIAPAIRAGKRVIVAAHGNSLRALVKYLDNVSEEEIVGLNIPTAIPLVYEFDENLKPIRHYYLADEEKVSAATHAVASQGTADAVSSE
eukprot:TRINITY_DN7860_c0_g1_i1.p1 TRINITY_DN7860_c0_g1~~TRINITY_DN7860_c0_g1_i1.p1  ORF type:complete len:435 (-),score=94.16 TRINITY_DN7860_c0_g1_i1:29-1333(-)